MTDELGEVLGPDRRTFLKRLIIGTAFAAPVVSSFTMSGVQSALASTSRQTTIQANTNTSPPTTAVGAGGAQTTPAEPVTSTPSFTG